MANQQLASTGRFSSQMLTYLGVQRTVQLVNGQPQNVFTYATGPVSYPSPGSVSQSDLGGGVVGNFTPDSYNSTVSYFLSRGVGPLYADTMTALAMDMAAMQSTDTITMLASSEANGLLAFTDNTYIAMNNLRDPGNQIGSITDINNADSLQANQIRS